MRGVSREPAQLAVVSGASEALTMQPAYVGIDPGLGGALALVCGRYAVVEDTPAAEVRKGRDYLVGAMVERLREMVSRAPDGGAVYCALEQGIAMPRQSSGSTFKAGRGIGLWEGVLAALGVSYELVRPVTWKRDLGLPVGASKGESRALAARLFPQLGDQLARVKDDGRAEALLIAEWRRRRG